MPSLSEASVQALRIEQLKQMIARLWLEAEEQAIIWSTRTVNAVEINDVGFDKAAEQVMPVAAVAREPGCIEAENGANFAQA